jgi:signal transduction histidine kinase
LLILLLGFGALMTGVFLIVMRVSHEAYHLEFDQMVNRDLARQYVAAHLLIREPPLTAHNFARALDRITSINPNVDVYVLDGQGRILAGSAAGGRAALSRVDINPIVRFLEGHAEFPLLGDDPVDAQHPEVFSAATLSIPDCPAAYLYVVLSRHESMSAASRLRTSYAIGEGAGFIVAAIVLAIAGSVVFLRLLTRRLGVLQHDIERFRDDGEVAAPVELGMAGDGTGDEIERLRRLFVQLTERIRDQVRQLRYTDAMRREFLANISHDLRTPLATLQAHVEALSLKDDLPRDERQRYLAVTLQQCQRLVRLVEQLLEVAKLDARQVPLKSEPFQIAELVQDVAMKWQLAARGAGVTVSAVAPTVSVPLVTGDIALIERVLDNLMDNAVRYAGTGGQVTLRLTVGVDAVRVDMHNTGAEIATSERAQVFDRFFRGDKSRPAGSGHAGLGLAIVRGILDLHGSSIDFVSPPGGGTTFFFDLPMAACAAIPVQVGDEAGNRENAIA